MVPPRHRPLQPRPSLPRPSRHCAKPTCSRHASSRRVVRPGTHPRSGTMNAEGRAEPGSNEAWGYHPCLARARLRVHPRWRDLRSSSRGQPQQGTVPRSRVQRTQMSTPVCRWLRPVFNYDARVRTRSTAEEPWGYEGGRGALGVKGEGGGRIPPKTPKFWGWNG